MKLSGATKIVHFLRAVVGRGGTFYSKSLFQYASYFGIKKTSISGTLNNLKKKGLLRNQSVNGQRAKLWTVI